MRSTVQTLFNDVAGHTRRKIGGIYAVLVVFNLSVWGVLQVFADPLVLESDIQPQGT